MPINVRDEQIIRESVIRANPHVRDGQVFRESVIRILVHARDVQVFRETIIKRTGATARFIPPNVCIIS